MRAPAGPSDPPSAVEAISPAWLSRVLAFAGVLPPGSTIVSAEAESLARGSGLTGRLARVNVEYAGTLSGPPSLIAKFPALLGPTRDLADRFRLYQREARFYADLAPESGVPTPRLYYQGELPSAGGTVLLIEDVLNARAGDLLAGCTLAQAERLATQLAVMHARWWGHPQLDALAWLPKPNAPGTLDYAAVVARGAWRDFRRKAGRLPSVLTELGERLSRDASVLERLGTAPRTLVHGDMRVNNVMWAYGDEPVVRAIIDWQTALAGRGPMDIAALFVNNLAPDDRRTAERELLPAYHISLVERGVRDYSFEDCWTDYRLAVMNQFSQVVVISSLLDISSEMDDDVTAATGARMFHALQELDLLSLLPKRRTGFGSIWRR